VNKIPRVLLLIETSSAYDRRLLLGISKYVKLHGPWIFFESPPHYYCRDHDGKIKVSSWVKNCGVNGIIVCEPWKTDEILSLGLPTITSPDRIQNLPALITDSAATARIAAEHLLSCGFRNFAYCGFDELEWSRARGEYFARFIAEAGFETHVYRRSKLQAQRSWDREQGFLADWLKSLTKPVGLMACNDYRGGQLTEICRIIGLDVPGDIGILGVDNDELFCEFSDPPLSSVPLAAERAGYEAAELLDKLMAGKKKMAGQTIVDRPGFVVARQSTNILAIKDREIAEVVRYIRDHFNVSFSVSQVADEVAMSRRSLERRFRKALGCTVKSEINRVRVERLCSMLAETTQSVSEIAMSFGFPSVDHISRYFRRNKGMSPLTYRKRFGLK